MINCTGNILTLAQRAPPTDLRNQVVAIHLLHSDVKDADVRMLHGCY
jgi:hypothetical protein